MRPLCVHGINSCTSPALATATLATSAFLALTGSDSGPLSAPRSLAELAPVATFALLAAHTLSASFLLPLSLFLGSCRSLRDSYSNASRRSRLNTSSAHLLLLRPLVGPAADWRAVDPTTATKCERPELRARTQEL